MCVNRYLSGWFSSLLTDAEALVYNFTQLAILGSRLFFFFFQKNTVCSFPKEKLAPFCFLFYSVSGTIFDNTRDGPTQIWTHFTGAIVCLSAAAACRRTGA